ncbi:NINE protein [Hymenobacter sp. IS2118]|uniref:NINE protein n=1 Tax=Hymenobacter sp. IS2118 TaxID=1505605 RepID=UPI00054E50CE|nr:NINE protein [Hymenobacter sp. IS2118]
MLFAGCQRASYPFQTIATERYNVAQEAPPAAALQPVDTGPGAETLVAPTSLKAQLRLASRRPAPTPRRPAAVVAGRRQPVLLKAPDKQHKHRAGNAAARSPQPPVRIVHKGVVLLLAVLLGFFGAHLFYIGDNRRARRYLLTSLGGLALAALALPIASLAFFGGGWGAVFVLFVLVGAGLGVVLSNYFHALVDGIAILFSRH